MTRLLLLTAVLSIASFTFALYPTCATPCVYDSARIEAAGCTITDGLCQCTTTSYVEEVTCCIRANCDSTDQTTAFEEAVYVCGTYGVTLNTQQSISCSAATTSVSSAAGAATYSSVSYTSPKPEHIVPKKKGLSSGAKGGIGGGIAAFVLAISTLSAFLLKRRNSQKAATAAAAAPPTAPAPGAPAVYQEKGDTAVAVNPVPTPAPQYTAQGQYAPPPAQSQGQYPQPIYAPQPQYPGAPEQQQYAQYGQPPPQQFQQAPPQQFQQSPPPQQFQQSPPPQQFQQPYAPGPELQGSPIGQEQQRGFTGAELPGAGAPQTKHEAP